MTLRRLIAQTKKLKCQYLPTKDQEAEIETEPVAELPVTARIAVLLDLLKNLQGFAVAPHDKQNLRQEAVSDESEHGIVLPVGDFHNLAREGERRLDPRGHVVGHAKLIQHGKALHIGAGARVKKLFGCGQGRDRFRRRRTFELEYRAGPGDVERKFERLTLRPIRQTRDQRQAGIGIVGSLDIDRARQGQLRRLQPIAHCRLCEIGLSEMASDDRRRGFDFLGETLDERPRDFGMDALTTAAQQRGVSRVLH